MSTPPPPAALRIAPERGPTPARLPVRPAPPVEPNAVLVDREEHGPSVLRLTVRPASAVPEFAAGQYLTLGLAVDGRLLQRPYSTASAPGARDTLEFLVRLVPAGALTPRLWQLRPGDRLWMGRPKGLFRLVPDDRRAHLLVATGTGLAPLVSMVAELRARPFCPRVVVVHGVATQEELAYRDLFESLAVSDPLLTYVPAISRPADPANAGWAGASGRLDAILAPLIREHRLEPEDAVAYLCGNPGMISGTRRALAETGVPEDAVISEQYWAPPPMALPG